MTERINQTTKEQEEYLEKILEKTTERKNKKLSETKTNWTNPGAMGHVVRGRGR